MKRKYLIDQSKNGGKGREKKKRKIINVILKRGVPNQ